MHLKIYAVEGNLQYRYYVSLPALVLVLYRRGD